MAVWGVKIIMKYSPEELSKIFFGIKKTLLDYSDCSVEEFNNEFDRFKHFEGKHFSDNDYYVILVYVTFYSGFKAATIEHYREGINKYFRDYQKVMHYDNYMFNKIANDKSMIKNKQKIKACIENAKRVDGIVKHFGSFENYINSFEPDKSDKNLFALIKDLQKFDFLADITTFHFMMDIGLNVLKPDRVIVRIFERLGLITKIDKDKYKLKDYFDVVKVGRMFSEATGLPIRYVDVVFVIYGQVDHALVNSVCSEENPRCDICGVSMFCNYSRESKETVTDVLKRPKNPSKCGTARLHQKRKDSETTISQTDEITENTMSTNIKKREEAKMLNDKSAEKELYRDFWEKALPIFQKRTGMFKKTSLPKDSHEISYTIKGITYYSTINVFGNPQTVHYGT